MFSVRFLNESYIFQVSAGFLISGSYQSQHYLELDSRELQNSKIIYYTFKAKELNNCQEIYRL